jgi:hypothetical protein
MQFRDTSTGYVTFWHNLENSAALEDLSLQYNVDLITRDQTKDWPFPRAILYNPEDLAATEVEGPQLGLATVSVISNNNYSGVNLFEDLTELSTQLYCNRVKSCNFYRETSSSFDRRSVNFRENRSLLSSGIIRNSSVPPSSLSNEVKVVRPVPTRNRTITVRNDDLLTS